METFHDVLYYFACLVCGMIFAEIVKEAIDLWRVKGKNKNDERRG